MDADAVVAIAKDAGFMISADDLKNAQSQISDEELEGVDGGSTYDVAALGGISTAYSRANNSRVWDLKAAWAIYFSRSFLTAHLLFFRGFCLARLC